MQKRMEELIIKIKQADIEYYQENNPSLSDFEYDKLVDELVALEKETGVILDDSPTQKVSGNASKEFTKYEHRYPMLSLGKTKSKEEIKSFVGSNKAVLSYKLDGLTLVAYYRNHKLDKLVTRGNGKIGEDITDNIDLLVKVPRTISKELPEDSVIRGEAVMAYSTFDRINKEAGNIYKNPRNLSSGLVRSKTSEHKSIINFVTYELCGSELDFDKQLDILAENDFEVVKYQLVTRNNMPFDEFSAEKSEYPVDGLVIRLNSSELVKSLGTNNKTPKYAMAFKWKDDTVLTKVTGVNWSVARTGNITPVVEFEPVEIEGTTVSRASAHNLSIFNSLQLGIGDEVEVYKANMIIPQILKNHTKSGTLEHPDVCPSCGSKLSVEQGTSDTVLNLICHNHDCPAKLVFNITLFASKEGFDIVGLSEKTIEMFIEHGLLTTEKDIFSLEDKKDILLELPSFGEKSYSNLINAINKSKKIRADKFIRAFGIDMVGGTITEKIFANNSSKQAILDLLEMDAPNIRQKFSIGEVVSSKIANYPYKDKIKEILELVSIEEDTFVATGNSLQGLNFVITGKLSTMSRKALENEIKALGGNIQSGVNSRTNFLVNNDINSNSSKNRTAKQLGVPIISEEEMLEKLK